MRRYVASLACLLPLVAAAACTSAPPPPADVGATDANNPDTLTGDAATPDAPDLPDVPDVPPPPPPAVISRSARTASEHEPTVAIAPDGRVAAAWIGRATAGYLNVFYRVSLDGGAHWGDPGEVPLPADDNVGGDPSLAAAADGTIYLAWGNELRTATDRQHVRAFVAASAPGSTTFAAPSQVTEDDLVGFIDQPHIAATPRGLVVTYMVSLSETSPSSVVAATSTDGRTWTRVNIMGGSAGGLYANFARACASASRLYVTYFEQTMFAARVVLAWSDDGGASWPMASRIAVQEAAEADVVPTPSRGCVARGDEVWVLYGRGGSGGGGEVTPTLTDLRLAHSSDRGATIDRRASVQDPDAGGAFLFPDVALEPDGALDVAYYAGTDEGDAMASYRRARSTDGGRTFGPSVLVQQPLLLSTSRTGTRWMGDYVAIDAIGGRVVGAYADDSMAASHVAFFHATVP